MNTQMRKKIVMYCLHHGTLLQFESVFPRVEHSLLQGINLSLLRDVYYMALVNSL